MQQLSQRIEHALRCNDIAGKLAAATQLYADWLAEPSTPAAGFVAPALPAAGRPERPLLVDPTQLQARKLSTVEGRACLLHAIAHIEFNAINLALDAAWRFCGMPADYYGDWLRVAAEEASHFALLQARLQELGYGYGDFPAHNGLWELAVRTADDVLVRMALVPRLLEARGLDVTPGIQQRLRQQGDSASVAILDIILRDEIGHVAIGNRWYRWCCQQRALDPLNTFRQLLQDYDAPALRGPFHWAARAQAGFTELERQLIEELAALPPA